MRRHPLIARRLALTPALLLTLVAVLAVPSCRSSEQAPWRLDFTTGAEAVDRWLWCTECTDGELDAVVALGQRVVEDLAGVLRDGWGETNRNAYARYLEASYDSLLARANAADLGSIGTREDYVSRYVSNVDARQRIRAAQALGAVGGPGAEAALRGVLSVDLRADVHQAVLDALEGGSVGNPGSDPEDAP